MTGSAPPSMRLTIFVENFDKANRHSEYGTPQR